MDCFHHYGPSPLTNVVPCCTAVTNSLHNTVTALCCATASIWQVLLACLFFCLSTYQPKKMSYVNLSSFLPKVTKCLLLTSVLKVNNVMMRYPFVLPNNHSPFAMFPSLRFVSPHSHTMNMSIFSLTHTFFFSFFLSPFLFFQG